MFIDKILDSEKILENDKKKYKKERSIEYILVNAVIII